MFIKTLLALGAGAALVLTTGGAALAAGPQDQPLPEVCIPSSGSPALETTYTWIDNPAFVPGQPGAWHDAVPGAHHDAVHRTVHHDAITRTVHHEAVPEVKHTEWRFQTRVHRPDNTAERKYVKGYDFVSGGQVTISGKAVSGHWVASAGWHAIPDSVINAVWGTGGVPDNLLGGTEANPKGTVPLSTYGGPSTSVPYYASQVTITGGYTDWGPWSDWTTTNPGADNDTRASQSRVVVDKASTPASDEIVVDKAAWDEQVLVTAAYDEPATPGYRDPATPAVGEPQIKVVDVQGHPAVPAVTCDPASASFTVSVAPSCDDLLGDALLTWEGATITSATFNGEPIDGSAFFTGTYTDPMAGHYVLTFAADPGYSFGAEHTMVLDFVMPPALTGGDCTVPEPGLATASWTTTQPTCDDLDGAGAFDYENATLVAAEVDGTPYTELGNFPKGNHPHPAPSEGHWVLTFQADDGFLFAGGTATTTVTFDVPAYLTADDCATPPAVETQVAHVVWTDPNLCNDFDGSGFLDVVGAHLVAATWNGRDYLSYDGTSLADFHPGVYDATSEGDFTLSYEADAGYAFADGGTTFTADFTVKHLTAADCDPSTGTTPPGEIVPPVETGTPGEIVPPVQNVPGPTDPAVITEVLAAEDPEPAPVVTEVLAAEDPEPSELAFTGSNGVATSVGVALLLALSGVGLTVIRRRAMR